MEEEARDIHIWETAYKRDKFTTKRPIHCRVFEVRVCELMYEKRRIKVTYKYEKKPMKGAHFASNETQSNETKSNKTPSLLQGIRTQYFWNFLHFEHVYLGLQVLVKSPAALSAASCAFEPTSSPPFQQTRTHTSSRESATPPFLTTH